MSVSALSGKEKFSDGATTLPFGIQEFWQWMGSDLVSNAMRGVLAEFIVARALGLEDGVRIEWDACDFTTPSGVRVEVKSAAYCQTWAQRRLSAISFDIAPKWPDNIPENGISDCARRAADVYVFCLLHHQEKATIDPTQMEQWTFLVLSARVLDARLPTQKRIAISTLRRLDPIESSYAELSESVARAAAG
jgi:hypothetical protein